MKKELLYKVFSTIVCFTFLTITIFAQGEISHHISKSFAVTEKPNLIVDNKYGKVDCKIWNIDSIKINVAILVKGKDNEELLEIVKNINPQYASFNNIISVKTEIKDANDGFVKSLFSVIDIFSKKEVLVNYTIWAPAETAIEIKNKFGDVLLDNFTGSTIINLAYGDLRVDNLIGTSKLDLSFGKLKARNINSAHLKLKHFDTKIKNAEKLTLTSNASEIRIENVKYLTLNSTKDELEIENIGMLNGKTKLSDIEIDNLSHGLQLILENANLEIKQISPTFSNLDVQQKSSFIDINVTGLAFKLSAELESTEMTVPNAVYDIKKQMLNEKKNHRQVLLNYGNYPNKNVSFKGKNGTYNLIAN